DTFWRWMEFRTLDLGSIRGGSARKLIIYKHKDQPGWWFPSMFSDVNTAWEHLRDEFGRAFELAREGEWARIDELETLSWGPTLKLKTLHLYFPDDLLPVYSTAHLKHYLRALKGASGETSASSVVSLNRNLLSVLRS